MERNPLLDRSKEALVEIILQQGRENGELMKRVVELEKRLQERNPTERLAQAYSLKAEEQRQAKAAGQIGRKQQKSKRRGRIATAEKLALATQQENVLPSGRTVEECRWRYARVVWRIRNGQVVLVRYDVYVGPDGKVPPIEGVYPKCEFGREIILAFAWNNFVVGLSLDKCIAVQDFYTSLKISKSQVNSLLNRLMKEWLPEFDALCDLLAVSAVLHADETGWSLNSAWTFLSEMVRLTIFGCHKDGDTLAVLLNKSTFKGFLVSDHAAVYNGFSKAQKCCVHLLRKGFKLKLLLPENVRYRQFSDTLLAIYRRGKELAADATLTADERREHVEKLTAKVLTLTTDSVDTTVPLTAAEKAFRNLNQEVVDILAAGELFTFVLHPEVPGHNNSVEQAQRQYSQDRQICRASKTAHGCRRRTVVGSTLNSLRCHLPKVTLQTVLDEVNRWSVEGISCFRRLVNSLKLPAVTLPEGVRSRLDLLVPLPQPAAVPTG